MSEAIQQTTWKTPRRSRWQILAIVATAVLALSLVLYAWNLPPFVGHIEQTENAYVRGRTTLMAPQVNGYVVDVPVRDYEVVRAGQLLAKIDDRIYRARVEQARAAVDAQQAALANSEQAHASRIAALQAQTAALENARAQALRAHADMARVDDLVKDGSVSKREQDQTRAALKQAEAQVRQAEAAIESARQDIKTVDVGRGGLAAQVEAARAQLRLAEIDLDNTSIRAPEDGQLGEIGVRLGQYVGAGTQLMALVPSERWVIANYKEAQTARMAIGQKATFSVDALDGQRFEGHVERLSPAAGSEFAVLKPDNATGNFIKVPQRIGVRIAIDGDANAIARLRPGMSVAARIDTRSGR